METKYLDEIRERLIKTTKGEWIPYIEGRDFTSGSSFIMTMDGALRGNDIEVIGATDADIDFIAHSKQDVSNLLNEIFRLREKIKVLGGDL